MQIQLVTIQNLGDFTHQADRLEVAKILEDINNNINNLLANDWQIYQIIPVGNTLVFVMMQEDKK